MKILIVTRYHEKALPGYVPGGDETVHGYIEKALTARGHTVEYLSLSTVNKDQKRSLLDKFLGSKLALGMPYLTSQMFRKIQKEYDLVVCNSEFGFGIRHPRAIVLYHCSGFGVKELYDIRHRFDIKKYLVFSRMAFQEKLAAKNKLVVSVSIFLKEQLERQGIKVSAVINNCVDTNEFSPGDTKNRRDNIFVGRADHYLKGFDVLEKIARNGIHIDYYSPQEISEELCWRGLVENTKMAEVYNKYQLLLFPSRFESVGMVPLEAMSCGVPVIMSNVGIGSQLRKEIPEFVVDGWSDDSIRTYLERRTVILARYDEFVHRARSFVENYFSYDQFQKAWCAIVDELTGMRSDGND